MRATSEPAGRQPSEAVCPTCNGIGYYSLDVPVGDPNFGVPVTCICKQREKEFRAEQEMIRISNLGAFRDKTFDNFDPDYPGVRRAYLRAREYTRTFHGWLVLMGNYGCGKTHLAAAIANEALKRHVKVLFAIVPDLLDHLRQTFSPNSNVHYDERFELIRDVPLLILDDLGTESTTNWAREKLYQIINHRYNGRLSTVITSNRDPDSIDQRIFSRMADRTISEEIIMIDAQDYRRLPVEQRYGHGRRRRY